MKNLINTLFEMARFLLKIKKFWLFPLVFVMILLGSLFIAIEGSVIAPLIYTLF